MGSAQSQPIVWFVLVHPFSLAQRPKDRAPYGETLIKHLSQDLTARFGRGFGEDNLELFRSLYLAYPPASLGHALPEISESVIRKSDAAAAVRYAERLPRSGRVRRSREWR